MPEGLFTLRPYQQEALAAVREQHERTRGRGPAPAVVAPTGSGKTVMGAGLVDGNERGRSLILVHTDNIAKQFMDKIHAYSPGRSIGLVKATVNQVNADVVVGSVQTLIQPGRSEQIRDVTLGIADECHHYAADAWMRPMLHHGHGTGVPWVGFTATLSRGDDRHLGDLWDVVYRRDIIDGIRDGSLCNARGIRVQVDDLVLDEVKRSRGDMQANDLGAAMMDADTGDAIARAYLKLEAEEGFRRRGVLFCPDVPTTRQFAEDLNEAGILTAVITGETPPEERDLIFSKYMYGEIDCIANCMVLTEGWDAPWCDLVIIARPTESAALYIQMAGRGLRPFPAGGKVDCVIMDVVGVSSRFPLATLADVTSSVNSILDGESLAEAIEREEKEGEDKGTGEAIAGERRRSSGELSFSIVDLFAGSTSSWLQTPRGVWFIPTRKGEFFLAATKQGFRVGLAARQGSERTVWADLDPMPMDIAMAWAEKYAGKADPGVAKRDSTWRNRPATSAKLAVLETLRIPFDRRTITQGQAYDLAATDAARRILDPAFGVRKAVA